MNSIAYPIIAYLIVLAWYDCRCRRLPNWLTISGALAFLLGRLAFLGVDSFCNGVFGGLVGGLFLLVPFLLRGAGGGDVKMLFSVGCLLGVPLILDALLFISLGGIVLGGAMIVGKRVDTARLKHALRCVFDWKYDRKSGRAGLPERNGEKSRIPFGVAISAGTVLAMFWGAYVS